MVLDDIGKHFFDHAVELVKAGRQFVFVVDNTDWVEKVHDMREIHQNKSVYAVATSMVFTRVSSNHLPDDGPQKDIKTCNFREIVSIKDEEMEDIRYRYQILVARILIKMFPKFADVRSCLSEELILTHEYSDTAACKSEIITMPVLMKDKRKYSDCVDGLDQLEDWTHEIYKASGRCEDQADQTFTPIPCFKFKHDQINLDPIFHLQH